MKIFKLIYQFVDKVIVMPISRFIYFLNKAIKKQSSKVDKYLNEPQFLIYMSLFLAVGAFLLVDSKAIRIVDSQAESISNVPVVLKYNAEAYVVEGVPEFVDITITGRKSDIYLAKQLGEYEVTLDLSDYTPRDSAYKVYFSYAKSIDNLTYKLDPSYVSVIIKDKVSETAEVTPEILNINKLDPKLSVKNITLDKNEVVVKGSESSLSQIATIKGLVDLKNKALIEEGTYNLTDVKLLAYDNSGKILNNIEIVPRSIGATVTLDSYSKKVPLQVKTTGSLIAGKAISSIQIDGLSSKSVTIYGDRKNVDLVNFVPITLNLEGSGKESVKNYNVTISKPNGIRHIDLKNINISLTFGEEQQKTIEIGNKITEKNLNSDYTANIISSNEVKVQVKGVSSVIEKLTVDDITAYVDLKNLGIGEHNVEVKIDNDNPLLTYVVSSTVTIRISKSR